MADIHCKPPNIRKRSVHNKNVHHYWSQMDVLYINESQIVNKLSFKILG